MPALDGFLGLTQSLAYVGLGPGQEFIPYFLSFLGFVGAALLAVLQWPFFALLRWFRPAQSGSAPAQLPEASHEGGRDQP